MTSWPHTASESCSDTYLLHNLLESISCPCGKWRQSEAFVTKKFITFSFLGQCNVGSLQDIAVNDEGGKILQKCDLQY